MICATIPLAGCKRLITTVSTVTTVTIIAALGLTVAISLAAIVALMVFLATRELATAGYSRFSLRIARFASVAILPLVMAFAVIVAVRIAEIL